MIHTVPQGAGAPPTTRLGSYRDVLASRGRQPVVIHRTEKRPGDKVLDSWAASVRVEGTRLTGEVRS